VCCQVIASSLMPRQPGKRVKNQPALRRDPGAAAAGRGADSDPGAGCGTRR